MTAEPLDEGRARARALFAHHPGALALYEALEARVLRAFPGTQVRAARTQVTFHNGGRGFACASPGRGRKQAACVLVSISLARRESSPRVWQAAQTSANRWTHHVVVSGVEDIDEELMNWMAEADSLPGGSKKKNASV